MFKLYERMDSSLRFWIQENDEDRIHYVQVDKKNNEASLDIYLDLEKGDLEELINTGEFVLINESDNTVDLLSHTSFISFMEE